MLLPDYKTNKHIAVAFDELESSQLVYTVLEQINRYVANQAEWCFSAFVEKISIPPIPMLCAKYHLADCFHLAGHLICTSINSYKNTKTACRSKRYIYIVDINRKNDAEYNTLMKDKDVVKLFRSIDHMKSIKGLQSGYYIGEFEINKILEIINVNS